MNIKSSHFALVFLAFQLGAFCQVPAYVPVSGLQAYWSFSGNANDLSGHARNGTVFGATLTNDHSGNPASAYHFGGNADIKTQYAGVLGTSPRAVSFWARTSQSVAIMSGVAWGSIGTASRYECGFNYGAPGPMLDGGDGVITYSPPAAAHDSKWHHYVMQFCSSSALSLVKIYQDGVLLTTTSNVYSGTNTLNTISIFNVRFGSIPGSPSHNFVGDLDEIGIWDRCLTETEINNLYREKNCPDAAGQRSAVPCVSVEEREINGVDIFPNPVSEVLHLYNKVSPIRVIIAGATGDVLLDEEMQVGKHSIHLISFPPGIYFLTIRSGDEMMRRKVIRE